MASRAADNLRTYFRKATLPEMPRNPAAPAMPPTHHRSQHVSVQVGPQPWRQLDVVKDLEDAWGASVDEMAISWADDNLPGTSLGVDDLDSETGDRFTVPCPPTFDIVPHSGRRPTDITRMVSWLDYLPLMSVQRALRLVFPDQTSRWAFSLGDDVENTDRKVFQYFIWSYSGPGAPMLCTPLGSIPRYPLVVAFQPPWILSERDIVEFSEARKFPSSDKAHNQLGRLNASERLWAKIWDTCVTNKTRWFVLTSYAHWVFGVFSEGWTIGFVSRVYPFNSSTPTILELLTFWTACAMRLPGWQSQPKVPERVTSGPPSVPACPTESSSRPL
ncbi:hypothetical protein FB45DRAFT_936050 [Roridomyces roridus]|uniref:Uncharacterized protein n=1 Tax=Roridomyces roridus TaxID=1738132 RepID=A0AAD7BA24_9AGAR|nr:hypothetical protein FB45DRAFT_936050 [Roridomyces roridus]